MNEESYKLLDRHTVVVHIHKLSFVCPHDNRLSFVPLSCCVVVMARVDVLSTSGPLANTNLVLVVLVLFFSKPLF